MIDWRDLDRTERIRFVQVAPTDLETEWGELEGVDLSSATIETAYYSDTRERGAVSVIGDGWRRGSFLRVYLDIPEWDYTSVLGTYIVTGQRSRLERGAWIHDLDLQSILKGLATERLPRPWAIAANASAKKAMADNLAAAARPWHDLGANDAKLKTPTVMETGTTRISALFALTNATRNRLDVDPMGYVTIAPYTSPTAKAPVFRFDLDDPRGIMEDDIELRSDWLELPDQVIVAHKYSEQSGGKTYQREIDAVALVPSDSHRSRAVRGYTVSDFRSVDELQPRTAKAAQDLAEQYLRRDGVEQVEWSLRSHYIPIRAGDVVELAVPDGDYAGTRHCLVKSTALNLGDMGLTIDLKETASGDEE